MSNSQIVKKYINLVYYIAQSRVDRKADVEDICRKVFLEYARQTPDFDSDEAAKTWFVKTTLDTINSIHKSDNDADIGTDEYGSEFNEFTSGGSIVSDELEASVLAAMSEQKEAGKIQDVHDIQNSDVDTSQGKRVKNTSSAEKIVMRVVAVVAAIVLIVTLTPLRGCVANSIDQANLGKMKKSSKGCTVEIVEAKAANDFLYLTVNESYNKRSISRDDETGRYILPDIYYSGSINSSDGDCLEFDSDNFLYLQYASDDYGGYSDYGDYSFNYKNRSVKIDDDWYKKHSNLTFNAEYKIYIPDLISFVEENGDDYTCSIDVSSEKTKSDIKFKFALDDVNDVKNTKSYFVNHWVDVDEVLLVFQRVEISDSCVDVVIEWDPLGGEDYDPDPWAELELYKMDNNEESVTLRTKLQDGLTPEGYQLVSPSYLQIDGKCYMIASAYDSEYDFSDSDITVEIKNLRCNYNGLVENYHDLKDIVLKSEKVNEKEYKLNTKISLGDIEIKLNSIKLLDNNDGPMSVFKDYTFSDLGFGCSIKYTGKDELAYWRGYMDLINPDTNETAKFSIQYYNLPDDYSMYHVESGFRIESYYMDNPSDFLNNLSKYHIASVTQHGIITRVGDKINEQQMYQNKWVNPKFKDVKVVDTIRGRKFINYTVSD